MSPSSPILPGRGLGDRRTAIPVLLTLLTLAVYGPSLTYDFVYDDHIQIQGNPWLRSPDGLRQLFTHPFWGFYRDRPEVTTNYYRPLYGGLYALTALLFGVTPLPFHAVSLLLHLAICILVALGARRMGLAGGWGAATAAGLLFALHPAHAEAVAWVGGQADQLAALFSLLALFAHLESRRPDASPARTLVASIAGPLAYLCAALSKETGAAFILVPFLVEISSRRVPAAPSSGRDPGRSGAGPLSRLGGYTFALALYLALRLNALGALAPHRYDVTGGAGGAISYGAALFARYLSFLVAPFPPQLLAHVPRRSWGDIDALAGFAVLLLVGLLALVAALRGRSAPARIVPLAFVVAFLLPVLAADAIGGSNFAERYLYLPSIGLAWLGGAAWERVAAAAGSLSRPIFRHLPGSLALAGLALWGIAAGRRAALFRNDLSLFSAAVVTSPESYIARNNLGMALYGAGRLDEAERQYREAIRLSPRSASGRINLGLIADRRGDSKWAEALFREALALAPQSALAALYLSRLERGRGDRAGAAATLDRLFAAGGESYETLCARADLWVDSHRPDRAVPLLRRAIHSFPDREPARNLLDWIEKLGTSEIGI